jgi:hypothetical protein
VLEQVTNGIATRMALLFQFAAGGAGADELPSGDASSQSSGDQPRNRRSTDKQSDANSGAKEVKDPSHASH